MSMQTTNSDVYSIKFSRHSSSDADLYVYQHEEHVPFAIKRVFNVDAKSICSRGFHAHKDCTQLLICIKGQVELITDDGKSRQTYSLTSPDIGILIPPGIWGEQKYSSNSILMVLTDYPYDENDYLRDYEDFKNYKLGEK